MFFLKSLLIRLLRPDIKKILQEEINLSIKHLTLKEYFVHGNPSRLSIGEDVIVNNALFNLSSGNIKLEENVFFGHNVSLLTGTHDISKIGRERRSAVPREGRDIIVRKGVWIASNSTVIGPCEIGENSVIGACSLVISNVPPNHFYAGVPAKAIRKIDFN